MSDLYVWEVREVVYNEGVSWSLLIKDDENSLDKVKEEVIKYYTTNCFYKDIREEQINKIKNLTFLKTTQMFEFNPLSDIEIEKVIVI